MVITKMIKNEELLRIARQTRELAELAKRQINGDSNLRAAALLSGDADDVLSRAKRIYKARRRRSSEFPELADLFVEPAWDMVLDLFIAAESKHDISIGSASIGAACPPTTGLRYIALLRARGIVELIDDPFDKRRKYIRLIPSIRDRMAVFLSRSEFGRP